MKQLELESNETKFDAAQMNCEEFQELTDLQLVTVGGGIGETAI